VLAMSSVADDSNSAPNSFAERAAVNMTLGIPARSSAHSTAQPDHFLTADGRATDQGAGL
jgi:hypothetical protein